MITLLISDSDEKAKKIISHVLSSAGYGSLEALEKDAVVKVLSDVSVPEKNSLKDRVVELGEALFYEKKGELYRVILEQIEKPLIEHILQRTEGNQIKAARVLGINRNTIRTKIKKLGIDAESFKR